MNPNFVIFFNIVFITLSAGVQATPKCEGNTLNIDNVHGADLQQIACEKGAIVGKSFEQIVREVKGREGQRYNMTIEYPFDRVAHNFTTISFGRFQDNFTIGENSLSHFPQLKLLVLRSNHNDTPIYLDIHPSAFERTKKLHVLFLQGIVLTDNTLRALEKVKDQMNEFKFEQLSPADKIFETVSKFTNLTGITFVGVCPHGPQPDIKLEKLSGSLRSVTIADCNIPIFTSNILGTGKLPNLVRFGWAKNNTTRIESGTFDRFENVKEISLYGNNLRELPDGLFSKNKKLKKVVLTQKGNNPLNVSPANFTHCDETPRLVLTE